MKICDAIIKSNKSNSNRIYRKSSTFEGKPKPLIVTNDFSGYLKEEIHWDHPKGKISIDSCVLSIEDLIANDWEVYQQSKKDLTD